MVLRRRYLSLPTGATWHSIRMLTIWSVGTPTALRTSSSTISRQGRQCASRSPRMRHRGMVIQDTHPSLLTGATWRSRQVPATWPAEIPTGSRTPSSTTGRPARRCASQSPRMEQRVIMIQGDHPSLPTDDTWRSVHSPAIWSGGIPMGKVTSSCTTGNLGRRRASRLPQMGRKGMIIRDTHPSLPTGTT